MKQRDLEAAFPTVVRYVGLGLAVVLVMAPIVTSVGYAELAGGYPLATGMILYKTVWNAANGRDKEGHPS